MQWIREEAPSWDESRAAAFTPVGPEAHGLGSPAPGEMLGDAWWRAEVDGETVGYGRIDDSWGDAEVLVVVVPEHRARGVGGFVMDRLEQEAAARAVNYVYNIVPASHPEGDRVRAWLQARGFVDADGEELRKRVTDEAATAPSA